MRAADIAHKHFVFGCAAHGLIVRSAMVTTVPALISVAEVRALIAYSPDATRQTFVWRSKCANNLGSAVITTVRLSPGLRNTLLHPTRRAAAPVGGGVA